MADRAVRSGIGPMILVGGVALFVQLLYLAEGGRDPSFREPVVDAATYHELAQDIASGRGGPPSAFWQPPLYPYLLAVTYRVLGVNIVAAKVIQALVAAASCVLTWWLGRRVFGASAGLAAGLVLALYGPLVFYNSQLLAAVLSVFLDLVALCLLVRATQRGGWHNWLLCGVGVGVASVARPNILVLLAVILGWLVVAGTRQGSWRAPAVNFAWTCCGTLAAIAPVAIRNYVVSGQCVLISTNGGINLFIGNNPHAEQTIATRPGPTWERLVSMPLLAGAAPGAPASRYFLGKTWDYVRDQPGDFAHGLLRKARLFFNAREVPRNVDIYVFRRYSHILGVLTWRWGSFGFPFGLVAPLAALGLIVGCRRGGQACLLLGFVAAYSGSVIAFFVASRYRLPILPALSIFAGWGMVWLWRQMRGRQRGALGAGLAAIAAAGIVVNLPARAPSDRVDFHAELHYLLGGRAMKASRYRAAETNYRRALQIHPRYPEAYNGLGLALAGQARHEEAIRQYRTALRIDPTFADAHNSWGLALADIGLLDRAVEQYERALKLVPHDAEFHYNLGLALARQNSLEAAAKQFREAIRAKPFYADAHNNLGIALARKGRTEQAIQCYRKALEAAPGYAKAHNNLANALAARGQADEAVRHYRHAIRLEPDYVSARYNLAVLLAAKGEFDAAIAECHQVIRLKPDFTMAYADLAEAYASAGRFGEAICSAQRAVQLAAAQGDAGLAEQISARLNLYRTHQAR